MKKTGIYTKEQLSKLISDLTSKAMQITNGSFAPTHYLPSYDDLATAINNKVLGAAITSAWLRSLFKSETKEDLRLSKDRLDWCCQFVSEKSSLEYFAEMQKGKLDLLYGKYRVFLKERISIDSQQKYNFSLHLEIKRNECTINPIDAKNDSFKGKLSEVLNGNAYFEFDNTKGTEKVYMIIHIGVSEYESLSYISGLYLSVNSDAIPVAGAVLLVREDVEDDVINYEIFDDVLTGPSFERIQAVSTENLQVLLKKRSAKNISDTNDDAYLSAFEGRYQVFYKDIVGKIAKAELIIKKPKEVSLRTERNFYQSGNAQIVSQDRLVIQLKTDSRFASLITRFGKFHPSYLKKIKYFMFVYSSTGDKIPNSGLLLAQRSVEHEQIEVGFFDSNSPAINLPNKLLKLLVEDNMQSLPDISELDIH